MSSLIRRSNPYVRSRSQQGLEPFSLMRDLWGWDPFAEMSTATPTTSTFAPTFDVKETKDAYVFKADLPGIEEKDLDISLTADRLAISGSREEEKREESETFYAYERGYGSFSRSFSLPEGVDVDGADAKMENGVLTISVPKKATSKPRKLSLSGNGASGNA